MKVRVNEQEVEVDTTATVADLVRQLGYPDKGIAVALDWAVIPKSDWNTALSEGARIEVVTAVQGG